MRGWRRPIRERPVGSERGLAGRGTPGEACDRARPCRRLTEQRENQEASSPGQLLTGSQVLLQTCLPNLKFEIASPFMAPSPIGGLSIPLKAP